MTSLNDDSSSVLGSASVPSLRADESPACDVAHGAAPELTPGRVLVAVFASPASGSTSTGR